MNVLEFDLDIPPSYEGALKKANDDDRLKLLKFEMNSCKGLGT